MVEEGSSNLGNVGGSQPSTQQSQTSVGFNTDRLPPDTSQNYSDFNDDDEAEVDPQIIRDDPEDPVEMEEED